MKRTKTNTRLAVRRRTRMDTSKRSLRDELGLRASSFAVDVFMMSLIRASARANGSGHDVTCCTFDVVFFVCFTITQPMFTCGF